MEAIRTHLSVLSVALLGIALGAIVVVLMGALRPSARAEAIRQAGIKTSIGLLDPGTARLILLSEGRIIESLQRTEIRPGRTLLAIRSKEGNNYLYSLPTLEGQIVMPARYWGQLEGQCQLFGPIDTSRVSDLDTIQCNDKDFIGWPASGEKWSLDGRSITGRVPALPKASCVVNLDGKAACI